MFPGGILGIVLVSVSSGPVAGFLFRYVAWTYCLAGNVPSC